MLVQHALTTTMMRMVRQSPACILRPTVQRIIIIRRSSSAPAYYQDAALQWGRANPEVAQSCLNLPTTTKNPAPFLETIPLPPVVNNWSDYWKWRTWDFSPAKSSADRTHAQSLTTHVLSAPLTIASHLLRIAAADNTASSNNNEEIVLFRCCCVGARAESMLPVEYWREVLLVWQQQQQQQQHSNRNKKRRMVLSFVGPDIVRRPPMTLTFESSADETSSISLELQWSYKGKFHDYARQGASLEDKNKNKKEEYDAFIFLNPGFGHAHLKEDWRPTLDLLFHKNDDNKTETTETSPPSKESPILLLLTAHSRLDADRDLACLQERFETHPIMMCKSNHSSSRSDYLENPFASHITYQDPFDSQHLVRPNQYYRVLSLPRHG
jgi:hypothetical protein